MHSFLRQSLLLLVVSAVLALAQWCFMRPSSDASADEHRITIEQATEMPGAIWIDARSADRYRSGHIQGAVRLTLVEWEPQLGALIEVWSPEKPLIVYCGSMRCDDAVGVAQRLKHDLSADNVYILDGGYDAWLAADRPVVSDE